MRDKVLETIKEHNLINKKDKLVLGVSGGADSIAMLYVLYSLKEELDIEIVVCHINHLYRKDLADRDENYVRDICEKLGVESYIYRIDALDYSRKHKMSFEEGSRKIRYECFDKVLKETASNKICIAQNKNDQIETMFMRLFRGSGLEGITSIKYKRDNIIRPILNINREDIEGYLLDNEIAFMTDHTNFETDYTRNKIRLELIPYIEENFNKNIINTLYDTNVLLIEDVKFIAGYVEGIYNNIVKDHYIMLSDLHLEHAILSRVIRKIIENMDDLKEVSSKNIFDIINLIKNHHHGKKIILKNIIFEISYDKLLFYKDKKCKLEKTLFEGSYTFNNSELIMAEDVDFRDINTLVIDKDKIKGKLYVRTRLPGDRFKPLGMNGHKKLKDYFINMKIPLSERDKILLLCDDDTIIWVVGHKMNDDYKITKDTKNKLSFKYIKY